MVSDVHTRAFVNAILHTEPSIDQRPTSQIAGLIGDHSAPSERNSSNRLGHISVMRLPHFTR